jgi:two-component system, LytTR family, response regulator
MNIRAYLVDDEPLALRRLKRLLLQTGKVDVVGAANNPEEAISGIEASRPDVCFLDIQMPRLNGFDVLARLPFQPLVVFTTAFEQYALKAFSVNSIDYLLKPVDAEQLERAIAKIETMRSLGSSLRPDLTAAFEELARSLRQNSAGFPNRIASRLGDRLQFIDLSTVTHFYAEDKLTYAVSGGKSYCVDSAISDLETKLDPGKFLRIHRSTIINVDWLKEISSLPGGGLNVRLKSGVDLTVSRDRARDFKSRLGC